MPCPACGSPIAADDTFCGFCGYAKEEQGQWRPPAPPQAPQRALGPAAQGSPQPMPSGTRAFPGIVWSVREPGTNLSDLPDGRRTLVRLNAGTRVREEGRQGGAVYVRTPDGRHGWVPARDLLAGRRPKPPPPPAQTMSPSRQPPGRLRHVREPGAGLIDRASSASSPVPAGMRVLEIGREGDLAWVILPDGRAGWVPASALF